MPGFKYLYGGMYEGVESGVSFVGKTYSRKMV